LVVVWPDKTYQTIKPKTNQTLTVKASTKESLLIIENCIHRFRLCLKAGGQSRNWLYTSGKWLYRLLAQKLIPYQRSDRGPATIGDLNGDGKEDVFFGGSKTRKRQFTFKVLRVFKKIFAEEVERDSIYEDASAVIGDFNNDKVNDLFVASGGGENALIYKTASTFPWTSN
jgi:hypothetical protein